MWLNIDNQGRNVLDYYIPDEIVSSRNKQEMRIVLRNRASIQFIGSDNADKSLVGTNAAGMIFSEFAMQDPNGWQLALPILRASRGWALFISTVRGKLNHFYDFYHNATKDPEWFCQYLTLDDTKHISKEDIQKDIDTGVMSEALAMQEYYNDWSLGQQGSYYGAIMDKLLLNGRITNVEYDPYGSPVITAWDLGFNDPTAIIFAQVKGNTINVFDYHESNGNDLSFYVNLIKQKGYRYGAHVAPFDISVHEFTHGFTRWQYAYEAGLVFDKYSSKDFKRPSHSDGIETVRATLPRMMFDETRCAKLLNSLQNYAQKYDTKNKRYLDRADHFASDGCDAMRYLCVYLQQNQPYQYESSPQEIQNRYLKSLQGW